MTQKTILVTGGAGFIGSHLCEQLVKDGHKVISLDNYFTGSKDNHVDGVDYREGHTKDIGKLITEKIDLVYHLGEYSRVAAALEEPDVVWDLNINGTYSVLEFCRKRNCKIVYAGSSTKFADPSTGGIEGRDLSPYTWAKFVNSELVRNYGEWYKLPYAIVYFYNVYGPREMEGKYGTVIEIFRQKFLNGEVLPVRLPGTQERTYTHVEDTVAGLVLVGEKGEGDDYGISGKESYPIKQVAELFGGEIEMLPARKTSRPSSHVDTTNIEKLGWKQTKSLEEYIEAIKRDRK
jgi:UDP-glucose 4-epimerase